MPSLPDAPAPPAWAAVASGSERDDIQKRVNAFRRRQSRILHDREAYYDEVQERIRSTLGNDLDGRRF